MKMMRKIIPAPTALRNTASRVWLCLLFIVVTPKLYGQQQVMFTQYMFNQLALNPAYAGIHEGISASLLLREQWVGFEGAPSTQTFSTHSPLGHRPISIGGTIVRDRIGINTETGIHLSYAYRIRATENSQLSFGLQSSLTNYNADFSDAATDPSLAGASINDFNPNVGMGVMWHSERFYLGFSIPQMLNYSLGNVDGVEITQIRHYFISSGYVFDLSPVVKLKPNVLLKAVQGAPVQIDLNANVLLKELIWLGISYRSFDSIDALFQLQITPQFQLGYAYDFATTTEIRRVNSGSHEIMLNYIFHRPSKKILTPRYF